MTMHTSSMTELENPIGISKDLKMAFMSLKHLVYICFINTFVALLRYVRQVQMVQALREAP